jgi:hypothetical protein
MRIVSGTARYTGRVIGRDAATDVALIHTGQVLPGHTFRFATSSPEVGDPLAVIGYPLFGPISFTSGSVSGLNRQSDVEGQVRTGLLQTDAAINPGNSGGPVLNGQGDVVGLVDAVNPKAQGLGYAVATDAALPLLRAWESTPAPVPPARCVSDPALPVTTPSTPTPYSVIAAYFHAINLKDWPQVWALGGKNLGESYGQMVNGYAQTAHDQPFVYKVEGGTVSVALLATEDSGSTQSYLGSYTVEGGQISSGRQQLLATDSGHGYSNVAGLWEDHGRLLAISPGGLGIVSYRTYYYCSQSQHPGCDSTPTNDIIINGGLTTFRLSNPAALGASGVFLTSTTGLNGSLSVGRDNKHDTLSIPRLGSIPFCTSTSRPLGICGA